MKATSPLWQYRLAVTARVLAAAGGGYALAAAFAAAGALGLALWVPRVEAVMMATLLSWLVYAAAAAWVFYARTWWGAWLGVAVPALVLGGAAMAPRWLGSAA